MAFGGRGFAGGLAGGMVTGYKLGMEMEDAQTRRQTAELEQERMRMENDARRRDNDILAQRRSIIDRYTTEDAPVEDAAGNVTQGRRPKQSLSLTDEIAMNRELGRLDFENGKMSQADFMSLPKRLDAYRKEGVFDALNEMATSGNPDAGIKRFNSLGGTKIKAYTTRQVKDAVTGLPTTEFTVRTDDDNHQTFNLADMARSVGGIDKYIEWAKLGESARARATAERKNDLIEQRNDQQFQLGMERSDREGRRLEAMIAGVIGGRRGGTGTEGGVFGYKMKWLEDNLPDLSSEQRYALASGQKSVPDAQIRQWAETAVSRDEKTRGIPYKKEERPAVVAEKLQFLRGMAGGANAPGPGGTPPTTTPGGGDKGRNFRNLWGG